MKKTKEKRENTATLGSLENLEEKKNRQRI